MLFFKSKKYDEILPPPPPEAELEEIEKPELFDEVIKPEKVKETKEEAEFEDLLKEVKALKPKKVSKKLKTISKEKKLIVKPKIIKKQVKKIKEKKIPIKKIIPVKRLKEKAPVKKIVPIKVKKTTKKQKAFELPELEELGLKEPKFELSKEEPTEKEIELPETLEDFDIEDLGKELELEPKTKPKELIEAEDEIKSAIEKIRYKERPSLFKRLFTKEKIEETGPLMLESPEVDGVSKIKNDLNKAREALMKFDLDTAKKNYIEIMGIYNNLRPEEQAKIYHEIRDLYFERKSAEELKV